MGSAKVRPPLTIRPPSVRAETATGVSRQIEHLLVTGICMLLAFGPLAFGAVQEWAICVLEVGAAFLLLIWIAREFSKTEPRIIFYPAFVPVALFGMLILFQLSFKTSAYWYATWYRALLWAAYGVVFFLVSQCFCRTSLCEGIWNLLRFLRILYCCLRDCAGVYLERQNLLGSSQQEPRLGLRPLRESLPLRRPDGTSRSNPASDLPWANLFGKPLRLLFAFLALVIGVSIFLSQSLGGMLAFTVEIGFLVVFLTTRRSKGRLPLLVALCAALAVCVVLLRPHGLADRLANLQHPVKRGNAEMRAAIVKDSVKMVKDRPIIGWGLGTFPVVYPSFRSFYTNFFVNEAHNDFVQLLVETGIAGFSLIMTFLVLTYKAGIRGTEHWRYEPRATMALAALIGCTGLLIHGLADFNLQIPANAALFVALAAMAIAGSTVAPAQ